MSVYINVILYSLYTKKELETSKALVEIQWVAINDLITNNIMYVILLNDLKYFNNVYDN